MNRDNMNNQLVETNVGNMKSFLMHCSSLPTLQDASLAS